MLLASLMRRRPDELRADFQQFYSLNIDGAGREYGMLHAAALAAQLPRESRCVRLENPEKEWSDGLYMLHSAEHTLRVLAWQQTEDAAKKRNFPKPLPTPADMARVQRRLERTDVDRINRILGIEGGV